MKLVEYEVSKLRSVLMNARDNSKRDGQLTLKDKEKIIWRLAYICSMGFGIDFGWLEILELISSDTFEFKQCGYVAASIIYRNHIDLLRLLVNTVKNDLSRCYDVLMGKVQEPDRSRNAHSISLEIGKTYSSKVFSNSIRKDIIKKCLLALNFIGNIPTLDFADNLFIYIKKLAEIPPGKQFNDTHIIRSKAICCLTKLFLCCPDRLRVYEWGEKLVTYFQFERNTDCLISQCTFVRNSLKYYFTTDYLNHTEDTENQNDQENISKLNDDEVIDSSLSVELANNWKFITPIMIITLSRIRKYNNMGDWTFHKVPMFWLQTKIMDLLKLLPHINNDSYVVDRMNNIIETVFFNAIHAIKSTNKSFPSIMDSDDVEIQCTIGIAVEATKYVNKIYNPDFPDNVCHLMAKFIEELLYTENKDYISISISLIMESKTIKAIRELIKKNLVALLRFTCTIDEDTTLNLLHIFSYICDENSWVFIMKEILNGVVYKYILSSSQFINVPNTPRGSSGYFYPGKATTLLEEIILSVCYALRRFPNTREVSFKIINVLFQLIEKSICDPSPCLEGITENTLFHTIDILFDSGQKNESTDEREQSDELFGGSENIQRLAVLKSYKLLQKLSKFRNNLNLKSGIRWLCFLLGEYGHSISNKISIIRQIGTLFSAHDLLTIYSDDEQIPLIKSTILISFTKLYTNSDHDIQNKIYEMLKVGAFNNSIDTTKFLNAIIVNEQYNSTPINEVVTPIERLTQNSSVMYRNKLLDCVLIQRKNKYLVNSINYNEDGHCNRNNWLSLCLSDMGSLYQFNFLSICFSNGSFKYSSGETTIIIKLRKNDKKNRRIKVERISTLCGDINRDTESSNSFSNTYDSTSKHLRVEIPAEMICNGFDHEGKFEQRVNLLCGGPYLNPPIISLLLRVVSNSKDEVSETNENTEEINADCSYSKLICINFRLPVILSNFMAPTKKMSKNEFEHFWGRLSQSSNKGILAISTLEIPIYLQLLNFCVYSTVDDTEQTSIPNSMIYSGTSTLYLSNRKRIPCMLKIIPCDNDLNNSSSMGQAHESEENEISVEICVRSSSLLAAKIIRQIISTYIMINSN
ncbi:adaptin AP complex subunit alpha protein [Cryptosporidium canis]|nr:adaptin AP complex subunit alpha protein [Cryptosporidium canis]